MPTQLLNAVAQLVYTKYDPRNFPEDVTREVFEHLVQTPGLMAQYQDCLLRGIGSNTLHKNIGQRVKERLGAESCGYGKCNPAKALITGYTKLRPHPKTTLPAPSQKVVTPVGVSPQQKTTSCCFPFGQPLQELRQDDRSPKKVFVLGVYASAVHARWIGPDGRDAVRALAVASEPYIFWRGEGADALISRISIPSAAGRLVPADPQFNGPSGSALDEKFLRPLGLTRDQAWLSDLVPHSCANESQAKAIQRVYLPLAAQHGLPIPSIPSVPEELADAPRRAAILEELRESQASVLILLGDQPIRWFLRFFDSRWSRLSDFGAYGRLHATKIDGKDWQVLPLVHPRQAGRLGFSSAHWFEEHERWAKTAAGELLP